MFINYKRLINSYSFQQQKIKVSSTKQSSQIKEKSLIKNIPSEKYLSLIKNIPSEKYLSLIKKSPSIKKSSSLIIPNIYIKSNETDHENKDEKNMNCDIISSSSFVKINKNNFTIFYMMTLLSLGILYIYNKHGNNGNKFIKII